MIHRERAKDAPERPLSQKGSGRDAEDMRIHHAHAQSVADIRHGCDPSIQQLGEHELSNKHFGTKLLPLAHNALRHRSTFHLNKPDIRLIEEHAPRMAAIAALLLQIMDELAEFGIAAAAPPCSPAPSQSHEDAS